MAARLKTPEWNALCELGDTNQAVVKEYDLATSFSPSRQI
jgi:hypothetical protein